MNARLEALAYARFVQEEEAEGQRIYDEWMSHFN